MHKLASTITLVLYLQSTGIIRIHCCICPDYPQYVSTNSNYDCGLLSHWSAPTLPNRDHIGIRIFHDAWAHEAQTWTRLSPGYRSIFTSFCEIANGEFHFLWPSNASTFEIYKLRMRFAYLKHLFQIYSCVLSFPANSSCSRLAHTSCHWRPISGCSSSSVNDNTHKIQCCGWDTKHHETSLGVGYKFKI